MCPLKAVQEDQVNTRNPADVAVNAYFDEQVATGTTVTCLFREFAHDTTHFPGRATSDPADALLGFVATKSAPYADAEVISEYNALSDEYVDYQYYTMTCLLAPGTGINSLDVLQQ